MTVPSNHSPAATDDRERFPEIKERIGEDPARWLDRPLFDGNSETTAPGWLIQQRIQGIDSLAVLGAWKGVEERLERGPRDRVQQMLQQRARQLEEIGERPERTDERDERDVPETDWYIVRDGERIPWDDANREGATVPLDASADHAVATDGGEPDAE